MTESPVSGKRKVGTDPLVAMARCLLCVHVAGDVVGHLFESRKRFSVTPLYATLSVEHGMLAAFAHRL